MLTKSCFKILLMPLFVFGIVFFLAMSDTALSQTGCCINNGSNCVGNGSAVCGMVEQAAACTPSGSGNRLFIAGEFCCQTPGQGAVCEPTGCCLVDEFECIQTAETACDELDGDYLGDGPCLPDFAEQCTPPPPTGCCETEGPACENNVEQNDCNDVWMVNTSCDGDVCGDAPPPINGCCQRGTECQDITDQECTGEGASFFPGGMCMADGDESFCEPSPQGCCVFGPGDCDITTAQQCTGEYQGDNTSCDNVAACQLPPPVISAVPTLSEWGLIAMAGLLGLFSLFIIVRRHRYNVN